MKPVLFTLGPIPIYVYGVFLTLALFLSLFIVWRLFKNNLAFLRFKVTLDDFFDSAFIFFLSFAIGARFFYIFLHWGVFTAHPERWFLFLHFPGFLFLGGVIGSFFGLWAFCKKKKLPYVLLLDVMTIGMVFAASLSQLGGFLAGDTGGKVTAFPLYEAFLSFVLFLFLLSLYAKGKTRHGFISIYFLLLIGIEGFFLEFLREDSVYLGGVAIAHIINAGFVLVATGIIAYSRKETIAAIVGQTAKNIRGKKHL